MLSCLSVLVLVLASVHLYLDRAIHDLWAYHLEQVLLREVRFARVYLNDATDTPGGLTSVINEMGSHLGVHATLINGKGRVLADSEVDPSDLSTLENHADHPEIIAALRQGRGSSLRYSNTLGTEMLYVATAVPEISDGNFVLRLALPLRDIEHIEQLISRALWMTSILGLGLDLVIGLCHLAIYLAPDFRCNLVRPKHCFREIKTPHAPRWIHARIAGLGHSIRRHAPAGPDTHRTNYT